MFEIKLTKERDLWSQLSKIENSNLVSKTGFFPESVYGSENDNLPVAQVAQWNEEGTETNPIRPFMRVGFGLRIERGEYDKIFNASIGRILDGRSSFIQEYRFIGNIFERDMKKVIADWSTPPNSPRTIEEKGFNDPLVDSETMLSEVKSKVERD